MVLFHLHLPHLYIMNRANVLFACYISVKDEQHLKNNNRGGILNTYGPFKYTMTEAMTSKPLSVIIWAYLALMHEGHERNQPTPLSPLAHECNNLKRRQLPFLSCVSNMSLPFLKKVWFLGSLGEAPLIQQFSSLYSVTVLLMCVERDGGQS